MITLISLIILGLIFTFIYCFKIIPTKYDNMLINKPLNTTLLILVLLMVVFMFLI